METVIGVRFQEAGKVYYFSPLGFEGIEPGEFVVVETSRGLEVARVVIAPRQVLGAELSEPLKPIVRVAFDDDIEQARTLKQRASNDLQRARQIVSGHNLPMKLVDASFNLDGSRLTLFFTSEARIDFRDLLRELSAHLSIQVQLRQVGPRDQAKVVDGYGLCGRRLCCSSWLTTFPAISIRMAKEQNKPLTPSKISGLCGRLLCCLSYENETYKELRAALPPPGTLVSTPSGDAKVLAANALRQQVTLQFQTSFEVVELPLSLLAIDKGVVRLLALPETDSENEPPSQDDGVSGPSSRRRVASPASASPTERAPAQSDSTWSKRPPRQDVSPPVRQQPGNEPSRPHPAPAAGERRRGPEPHTTTTPEPSRPGGAPSPQGSRGRPANPVNPNRPHRPEPTSQAAKSAPAPTTPTAGPPPPGHTKPPQAQNAGGQSGKRRNRRGKK